MHSTCTCISLAFLFSMIQLTASSKCWSHWLIMWRLLLRKWWTNVRKRILCYSSYSSSTPTKASTLCSYMYIFMYQLRLILFCLQTSLIYSQIVSVSGSDLCTGIGVVSPRFGIGLHHSLKKNTPD